MISGTIVRVAGAHIRRQAGPRHLHCIRHIIRPTRPTPNHSWRPQPYRRTYATQKSEADEKIEEIQEQYATARDEFEIAVEETEKKTVYAADDRAAAADELAKLKELYEAAIKDSSEDVAKEIQSRVGQRIRELDHAIQGLEKSAMED